MINFQRQCWGAGALRLHHFRGTGVGAVSRCGSGCGSWKEKYMQQHMRKGIFSVTPVLSIASDIVPFSLRSCIMFTQIQFWVEFWCGSGSDPTAKQGKMLKTNW
jgi:hypothetical protein